MAPVPTTARGSIAFHSSGSAGGSINLCSAAVSFLGSNVDLSYLSSLRISVVADSTASSSACALCILATPTSAVPSMSRTVSWGSWPWTFGPWVGLPSGAKILFDTTLMKGNSRNFRSFDNTVSVPPGYLSNLEGLADATIWYVWYNFSQDNGIAMTVELTTIANGTGVTSVNLAQVNGTSVNTTPVPVRIGDIVAGIPTSLPISGTVSVSSLPSVSVTSLPNPLGTVAISTLPSSLGEVSVSSLPAVDVNTLPAHLGSVSVSALPSPLGSVSVSSLPSVSVATLPNSLGTVAVSSLPTPLGVVEVSSLPTPLGVVSVSALPDPLGTVAVASLPRVELALGTQVLAEVSNTMPIPVSVPTTAPLSVEVVNVEPVPVTFPASAPLAVHLYSEAGVPLAMSPLGAVSTVPGI